MITTVYFWLLGLRGANKKKESIFKRFFEGGGCGK
jgi:hypothetical protein